MPVMPIADMRMGVANGVVEMGMRMPEGALGVRSFRFSIGVLMGVVQVLFAWRVQVLVLMPDRVMAMPVGMVFLEH